MNKQELIVEMAKESGLTKTDTDKALNAFTSVVTRALMSGDDIRLIGFGTLLTSERAATTGRNPRTGEPINIPSSRSVKFRAGKGLKDELNRK